MTIFLCTLMPLVAEANFIECAPPIDEICWSVTSYWPFNVDGYPEPLGGQADSDPTVTANGLKIDTSMEWEVAAVPFDLVGSTVVFPDGTELYGADTFGHPLWQQGAFIHPYWNEWVIGIDVMTPDLLFYLECDGVLR